MTLHIEGIEYHAPFLLDFNVGPNEMEIRARFSEDGPYVFEVVNMCDHCHRGDHAEVVCTSIQQAVDRGWLIPVVRHAAPPKGASITLCCGRTPFELPVHDRMTVRADMVTCKGSTG